MSSLGNILRLAVSLVAAVVLTRGAMWVITAGLAMAKLLIWLIIFGAFFYSIDRLLQKGWPSAPKP